jgi:hypothetical protein
MNVRQLMAYKNPCYRAHDTVHPRFRVIEAFFGKDLSSILTLNK